MRVRPLHAASQIQIAPIYVVGVLWSTGGVLHALSGTRCGVSEYRVRPLPVSLADSRGARRRPGEGSLALPCFWPGVRAACPRVARGAPIACPPTRPLQVLPVSPVVRSLLVRATPCSVSRHRAGRLPSKRPPVECGMGLAPPATPKTQNPSRCSAQVRPATIGYFAASFPGVVRALARTKYHAVAVRFFARCGGRCQPEEPAGIRTSCGQSRCCGTGLALSVQHGTAAPKPTGASRA